MADIKISALPTATTPLTGAELVPVVQGGVTKQTTTSDVLAVPITSLTASSAVATDASKKLVSVANTGTGDNVLATSPTLVTPILGTPQSVTLTNATGLPLTTGVTGLLPVANGGTGTATPALVAGSNVSITGSWPNQTINSSAPGTGTVTSVSVVSANGLAGTVANATTTPAITLSTSVTGVVKGNGTTLSAATAGTDYVAPGGALGTPSSGTVTNLTGTASININGTVGATTPAAVSATSLTDSGNLTFTGTGNRITGDFSNATVASRVMFQTSTANSTTWVSVLPNGTSTDSRLSVYSNSDPTNTARLTLSATSSSVAINSAIEGTGTYVPLAFATGGSERVRFDTSGNVGIGTASPTGRLTITESGGVPNANSLTCSPDATTGNWRHRLDNDSYSGVLRLRDSSSIERITLHSGLTSNFYNGLLVNGPFGLGYGTGSGGTVTQATSKSTTVTLNKPVGRITMNNAALAAGATVVFNVANSLVTTTDIPNVSIQEPFSGYNYKIGVAATQNGSFAIWVTNFSGGSLSEAITINFAVIKGATS